MEKKDLNKVTFFVGPNSSGKSVTAEKLAPALQWIKLVQILAREDELPMKFVNKWLERFNVPSYEDIVDKFLKGENFSTGTLHILNLVCSVSLNKEPLVWVEHPECNLYPRLQSHLANFFLDSSDEFGTRFIVETHSEYMLRRSQVIVRACTVREQENPYAVWCFSKGKEPSQMIYRENGRFSEKFEAGFYDESSCLVYQLI